MRLGMIIAGLGSVAAGVSDLIWGEFEVFHQPIQAWGDHIARIPLLAYIAAAWLIVAGVALAIRRAAQLGTWGLAILYAIFAVFPLPRLFTAPRFLGYHASVYIGVFVDVGQQLILFVALAVCGLLISRGSLSLVEARLARCIFGLCCIDFGIAHFTGVQAVSSMVPDWIPLGGTVWTLATGIAFVLAGLSIISGIQDVLAARLLGLMLLVFSAVVLTPKVVATPNSHTAWGGEAYNLTAVGCAWIFAGWLASRGSTLLSEQTTAREFLR